MSNLDEKTIAWLKKERDRLFLTEPASIDDKYARMRFEREIEGQLYVKYLRRGMYRNEAAKRAREECEHIVNNWKEGDTIYNLIRIDENVPHGTLRIEHAQKIMD